MGAQMNYAAKAARGTRASRERAPYSIAHGRADELCRQGGARDAQMNDARAPKGNMSAKADGRQEHDKKFCGQQLAEAVWRRERVCG